jgi:cytochrome c-type biogenesis protein CcmF
MIPELGNFSLILALCLCVVQMIAFGFNLANSSIVIKHATLNMLRPLALGQILFVFIGFLILSYSFVTDDFSVVYVANNSNSLLPLYYKLTAVWGAHEGSLLLWITILCGWMLAVVISSYKWDKIFSTKVLAVMGIVNGGFLMLLLYTSNPFLRIFTNIPLDGSDLNPLLQDIGMISHPPILYMGYVGSTVAFAFAIAGLLDHKLDQHWARLLRPWVLLAWVFLTLGITLGSWWAYYELGWGGWWFWDPVENASFMPWLTATALLHCLAVASKQGNFLRLALFLAIVTFSLSLLGTFIVRSGVITSVHAFVSDPQRGVFILQFLILVVGGALFLYGLQAPRLKLPTIGRPINSKEGYILANNILLLVATGTVLLGTMYPLMYEVLFGGKISVGYPYFNAVFVPIMLILFAVMLPGIQKNKRLVIFAALFSIALALLFLTLWFGAAKINAVIGLSFAFAIICNSLITLQQTQFKRKIAMTLAHLGLAVTLIGISITPNYEIEKDIRFTIGEQINIADYSIRFNAISVRDGPNFISNIADVTVKKSNAAAVNLYPEKRLYLAQELPMTETAILPGLFEDIYIALGQQYNADQWSARIYYKPFVRWIWLGAILMVLGALYGFKQGKKNYVE